MINPAYVDLLTTTALAQIATIGPHGEPQVTPVWFDWDGTHIRFSQTTTRQKYRNLKREPRIALAIVDPNNSYRYLEIRGHVVSIEPDENLAFIDHMAQKYLGQDHYPWHNPADQRVVITVLPEHTTQMGS